MLSDNYQVSKSKALIEAKFPTWETATINIFDTYLSRINPLDPKSSEVTFTKAEYEALLGVKELRISTLNKCITEFMRNTVSIEIKDENGNPRGWENYALFDKTSLIKNDYGEWDITLRCNPELKEVFFELKKNGYQKYRLKHTLSLTSKASKLLYFNLLDHRYGNYEWIVTLKELREKLGVGEKKYEKFKDFNKYILKKAEEEINEKTDIKFTYEKITKGKLTRAIKFKIEKNEEDIKKSEKEKFNETEKVIDINKDEITEIKEESYFNERQIKIIENVRTNIIDMNPNWSITDEQALELNDMIHERVFQNSDNPFTDDLEIIKNELLIKLLRRARSGKAKNPYNWLMKVWNNIIDEIDN